MFLLGIATPSNCHTLNMLAPVTSPTTVYNCSLRYVWKGFLLEWAERNAPETLARKRGLQGIALLLPFLALVAIGAFVAATGPHLTRALAKYGSVEAAVTAGALVIGGLACAPFFLLWKFYHYIGRLCRKGWEAENAAVRAVGGS